jgi:hypothetical protein
MREQVMKPMSIAAPVILSTADRVQSRAANWLRGHKHVGRIPTIDVTN